MTSNRSTCLCQIQWPPLPSAAHRHHHQPLKLRHHFTEEEDSSTESENISLPRVMCHCPTCCPDHYTWLPLPPTPPPPDPSYRRSASPRKKVVGRVAGLSAAPPNNRRTTTTRNSAASHLFTVIPQSSIDSTTSKCSCPVYDVVLS